MPEAARHRVRVRLNADERRVQIVEVATALIAERGFWGTAVQDVADACGLTVAGLMHHVGSKNGLLIAVLEHRDEADVGALAHLLGIDVALLVPGQRIPGVTLARLCSALVARNAGQPEIVRLYSVLEAESLDAAHPAHEFFGRRQEMALHAFEAVAPPDEPDPAGLARQVLALMDGLQVQWLRDPRGADLVEQWARVAARVPALRDAARD